MTENSDKPISEWLVDELFTEMEDFFYYLGRGGKFKAHIFDVFKEIILRVGPPYEVYKRFSELQSLLGQIKDVSQEDPKFDSLLIQSVRIWEEIKGWHFG